MYKDPLRTNLNSPILAIDIRHDDDNDGYSIYSVSSTVVR